MVFGEETVDVPIFNGLGMTGIDSDTHCTRFQNLTKVGEKELIIREDLILIQDLGTSPAALRTIPVTDPIPRNILKRDVEVFTAVGSQTVDSPSLLSCMDNATTLSVTWLNCNATTPISTVQTLPAAHGVKAFCQFRDRYYASNGSTNIFRLFNFTTVPATALSVTDVAAVGVNHLIAFKNRIFGFTKNRIYFTDLPAIGLYPETWNIAVNFIDLPSYDFDITIHTVKVYRDKIYIFTDKGIYYLQANGDPLNWSVQLISANFVVHDRDSVCVNKNLVFLTDQVNVYMFDGSKFERLPDTRGLFYDYWGAGETYDIVNLHPYEEGFLAVRLLYANTAGNYTAFGGEVFYYDMDIWSTINVGANAFGYIDGGSVLKAGTSFQPYRGKFASSYIFYYKSPTTLRCLFLDSGKWLGDILSTNHAGARTTKYLRLESPIINIRTRFFTKIKFLLLYGILNMADTVYMELNGHPLVGADMDSSIRTFKAPTDAFGVGSAFAIKRGRYLTIDSNVTANRTAVVGSKPSVVILGVQAVVNTNNRDVTETRT